MPKWIEECTEIKCPECGREFTDEVCCSESFGWPWRFCPSCGARIETKTDCMNLVKALRHCADYDCTHVCPRFGFGEGCIRMLKHEAANALEQFLLNDPDKNVGKKWEREMPTESGWYWVIVELVKGKREMFPAYFDAEHFYMQSIEDGIDCELVGVTHVMQMRFPDPPKEESE